MGKGEVNSTIITYVMLAVVAVAILIFGFYALSNTQKMAKETVALEFTKSLTDDIQTPVGTRGSVAFTKYTLPSNFNEICFVDTEKVVLGNLDSYPLIKSSVESGVKDNIFLFGDDSFGAFNIPNMQLEYFPYFFCVSPSSKLFTIQLESLGQSNVVKGRLPKDLCQNAQDKNLCPKLDLLASGYKDACCSEHKLCC